MSRNLTRLTDTHRAEQTLYWLRSAFPEAEVRGYEQLAAGLSISAEDRHVLAAAILIGADTIVTSNLRDFPEPDLEPFAIGVDSPDVFLTDLYWLDASAMTQVVASQAAALSKPPMSSDALLDRLAKHAPIFAELVRAFERSDGL